MKRFAPPLSAGFFVLLPLLFAGIDLVGAQEPDAPAAVVSADTPPVPEDVRQLMQERKYAEAVVAIDKAMQVKDAPADYLTYLKGRALYLQKEYDEAVAAFDAVGKEFPQSDWQRRARFGKAVALARKGDFRAAEVIYRAEAEHLLSTERKQEIADIYLEFADTYFKPAKQEQKPDYAKAMEFYNKALEVGPEPKKRIEVELLVAQCYQKMDDTAEAAKRYEKFIKDHPESELDDKARYRLGECYLKSGEAKKARRAWQDLLAECPDSELIPLAAYNMSRTWGIPNSELYVADEDDSAEQQADDQQAIQQVARQDDESLSLGIAALEKFIERFPAEKLASRAHLDIATSYVAHGRFDDAETALKRFLEDERYKDTEQIPGARSLLGTSYQLQKKFPEALAAWADYLAKHPAHKAWSQVQQQILDTQYIMAAEKAEAEDYDTARKLWSEFLAKYPLDGRNPAILFQFGRMQYKQDKWDAAITDWRRLVSKYPQSNEASRAQLMIGATLEQKQGKLEEALEEYRKVTWGNSVPQSQQAIARLTAKTMTVATERIFRSGESPTLKLTTRNIEKVTVRAYKVDLETYFRKMHLARGVEALDISLIDPDETIEFKVPEYVEHKKIESDVEIALPAEATAGVMAVTISSKTLETTTMVIQSDLDVIVKSSRDEVFVFAQDMRSGKPWKDARLLISDGTKVFAEGTTGEDGVFQETFKELKDAGDVRVFAIATGNVASNVVDLQGVGVAQGLADKGYIYTDRPAYRAGQPVHVRGCLRHVKDDQYAIEQGKKYTVDVLDNRNRLVHQEKIELGPFGSFHANFLLPATSPQGQYRVTVRDKDDKSFQGTFIVHEYQLEPVRLVIDTPRTVYYRGEEIEGTIRAEYYYGAPLAGREIRYQLADEPMQTVTTDEKGEVKFKLPTREFSQQQVLPLAVTLTDRNLQKTTNFMLAFRGYTIGLSTIRPVYVAGETFETTVTTTDAEGKPAGRKITLKVFEQTTVQGKTGERLVGEYPLETDETDGKARQTVKLDEGGRYILRAEGTDRFDNPITGQHFVQISDDKDRVRLRILADRHTFKVGDTASVRLHWREEPALALVTYQGARILQYELVELAKGPNKLDIPMAARLAPNFELAVAVMTDYRPPEKAEPWQKDPSRRFHAASSPFTVQRDLKVSITAARKDGAKGDVRPGEDVTVTVITTDPQGEPVAAEVSLAMIEQSLLERFRSPLGSMADFFRGNPRQSAVRTTSSVTFAYRPATRPISRHLLAEEERLEIAGEEEESRLAALENGVDDLEGFVVDEPDVSAEDIDFDGPVNADGGTVVMGGIARQITRGSRANNAPAQHQLSLQIDQSQALFDTNTNGVVTGQQWGLGRQRRGQARGYAGQAGANAYFYNGGHMYVAENTNGAVQLSLGTAVYPVADLVVPQTWEDGQNAGWQMSSNYVVLDDNGRMQNLLVLSGDQLDVAQIEQTIAELTEAGGVVLPGLGPQETGYWNPSVTTGQDGKATVSFTVPERSTAWKLIVQGITTETLAGEADGELVVKKDLFGQLRLPQAFADGDEARVMVSVHNDAIEKGPIEVTLTTTIAGRTIEEKQTLDVESKGIHELVFTAKLDRPEKPKDDKAAAAMPEINAEFALTVSAGERTDVVRRSVPLKPYGMPVFATASGSGTSDTTAWVEAAKEMPTTEPSLQILVGPTVERSLLDIVLGTAPGCQLASIRIASGLETSTSDLMASLGLQALLGGTRQADGPQAQALDSRVRSAVGSLVSSQNDDGGWSWTGRGGSSNRYGTSRVVWALSLARKAGYNVPDEAYDKAVAFLRDQVARIAASDYESKAILLHGLSTAGEGDFALANRLYRDRPTLSTAALAHLALAFAEMDRKSTAGELLTLLAERNLDDVPSRRKAAGGSLPWSHSSAELRALYALAVQKVTPKATQAKESVDWLLAHRTGHRWSPDKATGPAALALCRWFAENRFEDEHYKLVVFVNDIEAATLEMDGASGTQTVDVPAKLLADGKQRINFEITGRGRFTYQCVLGGFVDADKLKSTTPDWTVKRTYEPAPLEMDGREIPRGFNVLTGHYDRFRNPLTELPTGRRGLVELEIRRHNIPQNTPVEQLEYLVITEPIPAGATVIEQSVKGPFERFEIAPGAITFYVGSRNLIGTIRYQLHGYQPGKYRTVPTVIRDAYRPDRLAVSTPKSLTVLPSGGKSADKYRLSPQELFELGKRHFEKKEMKKAETHLTELFEKWNLNTDTYKKSVEMLLDSHLEIGPPARVVRYFEIIKERWPASEIPFAKILKVGTAYHEMGEYERSYLIFRATVESSFSRESGVAGFLEGQGEFARSVEVMGRLLREYPPEGYVASATYGLAQSVYAKAPGAADDEKLRKQKINRVDLIRRAWTMLEGFLTAYPEDPAADQAAFSAANALLELKAYDETTEACNRYAQRYPESDLLDSYWYMVGYCHFATGKHEEALAMCRKVAEARRTDKKTGRTVESPNKWRAVYILGQVYHSLGDAADAIKEYTRVEDRFADAKEAIAYFTRKAIELPEVTTVKPDTPVEVELKFRNVAACDVKVYRIDLMKFSLLKRNLGGITQINLSGIRPYHEAEIELGDGKDYRDRTHKLALPLKEQGAYLVVSRGDNLHASGLVLVTPLAVEVQEDTASGRVRTTVKNLIEDRYIKDIHVKVIGTRNSEFTSGETDLRGVFVADGIQGRSTVIAQAPSSHYAFFRGQTELVPGVPEAAATQAGAQPSAPQGKASLDSQLLEGLQRTNTILQAPKVQQLKSMYDSKGSGVKADEAF